ncbi:MAG: hypothetical protein WCW66_03925 [Patescibacteria group bacterium]|jgi:hypothetical protein
MEVEKLSTEVSLKKIAYPKTIPHLGPEAYVAYAIMARCVVFSGLTPNTTSTVNAAENIIMAICRAEGMEPNKFAFFDLQTSQTYGRFEPGEFELSLLEFNYIPHFCGAVYKGSDGSVTIGTSGPIQVMSWEPFPYSPEVVKLFAEQIGPNPRQINYG